METTRRIFLAAAASVATLPAIADTPADGLTYPFDLPPLPYALDALAPVIDAETMHLHHDLHHKAYVTALNKALEPHPELHGKTVEALLADLDGLPADIREAVRNQGGGHANHQLFWKLIRPGGAKAPGGAMADAIAGFGGLDKLQAAFNDAGTRRFGSGWVFLATDPQGQGLEVISLPNQDSVLGLHRPALLGNDLWEHAYYLTYRNRRADYLKAWWQVVNWSVVSDRLDAIRAGKTERLGGPAK